MASEGHTSGTSTAGEATERIAREYVDAGGVRTYYEVEGPGEPLAMLHGGSARSRPSAG